MNYKDGVLRAVETRAIAFRRGGFRKLIRTNRTFVPLLRLAGAEVERRKSGNRTMVYAWNVDVAAVQAALALARDGNVDVSPQALLVKLASVQLDVAWTAATNERLTLIDALGVWSLNGTIDGLDVAVLLADNIGRPVEIGHVRTFPNNRFEILIDYDRSAKHGSSVRGIWVEATEELLRTLDAERRLGANGVRYAGCDSLIEWMRTRKFWNEAQTGSHQASASQGEALSRALAEAAQKG